MNRHINSNDTPQVSKILGQNEQNLGSNLIFVWNDNCTIIEEIKVMDIPATCIVDIQKQYEIILKEIK
jgi:hypothetical protein